MDEWLFLHTVFYLKMHSAVPNSELHGAHQLPGGSARPDKVQSNPAVPQWQHRPLIWNPHVKKIIHVSKKAKIFLPLILKRIRRESDVRHLRLRGTSVSFLQIVTWDGERSWWRRRGRLQAAGAERGALRRRADLGGQRGTERGGGLSARSPGAATTSGSIRASRLEVRASLRQLEPRRPRLAAAVPGPTCRGREGGCGPAGHAWPPPCLAPLAGEGREGERPRRAARPLPAQCWPPLCCCRISRGPRSAVGCAGHRRGEREEDNGGEERGDPDCGLVSSNLEGLFAKWTSPGGPTPSISRSDG